MILETFDQEKHDEAMKKDWYEAGRKYMSLVLRTQSTICSRSKK